MDTVHMTDPRGCKFLFTHEDTMATARPSKTRKPRATYHHGDLRTVEAGL
jgi:hypothetical protein